MTNGCGVIGRGGCCRMINGGAGGTKLLPFFCLTFQIVISIVNYYEYITKLTSCWMIISPGGGGDGGFRYRMANFKEEQKFYYYKIVQNIIKDLKLKLKLN